MSKGILTTLPEELISQIATHCGALAVLRLSTTCRLMRSICYNELVFRDILESTQMSNWKRNSLNMACIQSVAGQDVDLLARYALADERAWNLSHRECPLENPEKFLDWMPQLFLVKHPFMYHQCWSRFLRDGPNQQLKQVFCQALAVLASPEDVPMSQLRKSLQMQDDPMLTQGQDNVTYLWVLCSIALTLRKSQGTRRAVWPYQHAANVPDIPLPTAAQISFGHHLPVPFSMPQGWDFWYVQHNNSLRKDKTYLTSGTWTGYYVRRGPEQAVDPPMKNIQFVKQADAEIGPRAPAVVKAENCFDGNGAFDVTAQVFTHAGQVLLRGIKQYQNSPALWLWDLRITPFGLLGFWGSNVDRSPSPASRMGMIWLWKEEWTARS